MQTVLTRVKRSHFDLRYCQGCIGLCVRRRGNLSALKKRLTPCTTYKNDLGYGVDFYPCLFQIFFYSFTANIVAPFGAVSIALSVNSELLFEI